MLEIISAIKTHNYVTFNYEGFYRKVIPFAYGNHATTHHKVMRGLQVGGGSVSGKFDFPKLFTVDGMSDVRIHEDVFEVPVRYTKGDKDINPIEVEL